MSRSTYQVITQGRFAPLDDEQRAALIAQADDHGVLTARFTEEGTITYDLPLYAFAFRVLIPVGEDDTERLVLSKAEELATAAVRELGAGCQDLRSRSSDLARIKVRGTKR
ncbi:DUF6204 family protein [Streptomyces sp. NPDC006510]|uniref:DUF6204 family protein n=1 Tax=Streptomyces sp. NPDC006510 TaxID=3155600 RepID=UPI0033B583E0